MSKIKTKVVPIEYNFNGILLKGELEYWDKDYCLIMTKPFESHCGSHLQYGIPVKYVIEKSKKPTCIEIDLVEKSKEILKTMYLNKIKNMKG